MAFVPAPEYPVFPTRERPLKPYEAVVLATAQTRVAVADCNPDVVVHDILTLAPAMAAELERVPAATLIPHLHPSSAPGAPPYALGARMPRTEVGRRLWRALEHPVEAGLRQGRAELNETREQLGLPRVSRLHAGISSQLCIVGAFPQLEYPRSWPAEVRVVGPLIWEPPSGETEPPPGDGPLVLIAPSTAQDPEHALLRASLLGLGSEPVRVLAATNRKPIANPVRGARQCAGRRLDLLRPRDAPIGPGRVPRGSRNGRASAGLRLPGARGSPLGRHGRERRADRLGRRRRAPALEAADARRHCDSRPAGRSATSRLPRGLAPWLRGRRRTTGLAARRCSSRSWRSAGHASTLPRAEVSPPARVEEGQAAAPAGEQGQSARWARTNATSSGASPRTMSTGSP